MKTLPAILACLLTAPCWCAAYTVVTDEHVDLQIDYISGSLSGRIKADNTGSVARGSGLLFDGPNDTTGVARPSSSTWNFLGVSAGQTVYVWPQSGSPGRIFLGWGSDGGSIPGGTFASYYESDARVDDTERWTKITLAAMRYTAAPGESGTPQFSLWQTDTFGDVTVWMATSDGVSATDATWLIEGGHAHYNWGFTKRGHYELDFKFSGYLSSSNTYIESATQTFHFGVEYQPAALPEPSSAALLALSGLIALGRRGPRARA